jgi:uncharacterized protein (DUF697 family)
MAPKPEKIHALIHGAALAAAAVGGGLAQAPGSDAAVITPLQAAMIAALGSEHGVEVSKAAAAELVLPFSAAALGRGASQFLLGWLPGLGNVLNAATAVALTEAIGWAANAYFGAHHAENLPAAL